MMTNNRLSVVPELISFFKFPRLLSAFVSMISMSTIILIGSAEGSFCVCGWQPTTFCQDDVLYCRSDCFDENGKSCGEDQQECDSCEGDESRRLDREDSRRLGMIVGDSNAGRAVADGVELAVQRIIGSDISVADAQCGEMYTIAAAEDFVAQGIDIVILARPCDAGSRLFDVFSEEGALLIVVGNDDPIDLAEWGSVYRIGVDRQKFLISESQRESLGQGDPPILPDECGPLGGSYEVVLFGDSPSPDPPIICPRPPTLASSGAGVLGTLGPQFSVGQAQLALAGYSTVQIIADGIAAVGSNLGSLKEYLDANTFSTAMGEIYFSESGDLYPVWIDVTAEDSEPPDYIDPIAANINGCTKTECAETNSCTTRPGNRECSNKTVCQYVCE